MTQDVNRLLARVEARGRDDDAHELLNAFFAGYPVSNLRLLLSSSNEGAAKAGAWIASELGTRARPLLPYVAPMLQHSSRYVRFFILDVVLACAGPDEGRLLGEATGLVCDRDEAVQWKAMQFLSRASIEQLTAAASNQSDRKIQDLIRWMLTCEGRSSASNVISSQIDSESTLNRLFGVVAASRNPAARDLLLAASQSQDALVCRFSKDQLRLLEAQ